MKPLITSALMLAISTTTINANPAILDNLTCSNEAAAESAYIDISTNDSEVKLPNLTIAEVPGLDGETVCYVGYKVPFEMPRQVTLFYHADLHVTQGTPYVRPVIFKVEGNGYVDDEYAIGLFLGGKYNNRANFPREVRIEYWTPRKMGLTVHRIRHGHIANVVSGRDYGLRTGWIIMMPRTLEYSDDIIYEVVNAYLEYDPLPEITFRLNKYGSVTLTESNLASWVHMYWIATENDPSKWLK